MPFNDNLSLTILFIIFSVMAHCWSRGSEIIIGDESHLHLWAQGGIAQVNDKLTFLVIEEM